MYIYIFIYIYIYIFIYIYIYIYIGKLMTVVKGEPKVSFSIATTLSCIEGHNSFPGIAPLYP